MEPVQCGRRDQRHPKSMGRHGIDLVERVPIKGRGQGVHASTQGTRLNNTTALVVRQHIHRTGDKTAQQKRNQRQVQCATGGRSVIEHK